MIPLGSLDAEPANSALGCELSDHEGLVPDPSSLVLVHELRGAHRRLELLVAGLDPRTVPQGVADAVHDSVVAMADAMELAAAAAWGWGAL